MMVENIERDQPQPPLEVMIDTHVSHRAEWNDSQTEYPHERCIHQLFEEQVTRTPSAIALVFMEQQFTYTQLNVRANQLAHFLQKQGVGPNVLVGLCMDRSLDMIVGVLGILKAGGAYVPLDPSYPPDRLAHMLQDAQAPLLLTQQALRMELPSHGGETICLDRDWDRIQSMPSGNPNAEVGPNNLIYVIYTSGSTGKPKGTAVFHRGFSNLMHWFVTEFAFAATDRSLLITSISFDLTQKNLYAVLSVGGQLHLAPSGPYDPEAVSAAIEHCGATHLNCTPSHFYPLVSEVGGFRRLRSLRYVYLGGEPIDLTQLTPWLGHPLCHTRLVNTYGPTECADIAAYYILPEVTAGASGAEPQADRSLPIGRPIPNTTLYILDPDLAPVPYGTVGELYIGGTGVGYGYVSRPSLTAEKFLPDPFSGQPGARFYRTGDMCRYLPDGNIAFLGRIDHQVKIRGYRIELGEIESILAQRPDVREVIVMAREDMPGDKRLVAYVAGSETSQNAAALREYLRERLPDYMIPAAFVFVETFPLSLNGKIDRRALPAPDWSSIVASGTFVAPCSPLEEPLTEIWQKMLGVRSVSVDANFFDLGGHSLLAIRLLSEIKRAFGVGLSLAEMIKAPTVGKMARLLQRKGAGEDTWSPLVPLQPNGERLPLFCAPVGGGSAFYYRMLAKHIGPDQPVYVFEPIAMNGIDPPHDTVEEMAAFYIQHMRAVQTHGPYHLCGLSFGGVVAFEMARQLTTAGEQVGCLIFFDSLAPGYASQYDPSSVTGLRLALQVARYKTGAYLENLRAFPTVGSRVRYLSSRLRTLIGRLRRWTPGTPWKPAYMNPVDIALPDDIELPDVFQSVLEAEEHSRSLYRPPSYAGRVVLLRTRLQEPEMKDAPKLGWDDLTTNIEVIPTPGTHYSILEEPCVHPTLRHVTRILEASHTGAEMNREGTPSPEAA
jgi:amino acid adenylation domain-containing protein